jgi:hypothetical protein
MTGTGPRYRYKYHGSGYIADLRGLEARDSDFDLRFCVCDFWYREWMWDVGESVHGI